MFSLSEIIARARAERRRGGTEKPTSKGDCSETHICSPTMTWLAAALFAFTFRPPAIPLITADPFMQTFIQGDTSTSDTVRHWDGAAKQTLGLVRIDGNVYGFLGDVGSLLPVLTQRSLVVDATRTTFQLELPGVLALNLTFLQTAFTDDIYRLARPVYYVTTSVAALDGKPHKVQVYVDASAQHVVNYCESQAVQWAKWTRLNTTGLVGAQIGSSAQQVLGSKCDTCNIDWGFLHLAINASAASTIWAGSAATSRQHFIEAGMLPPTADVRQPRMCVDDLPAVSAMHDFGATGPSPAAWTVLLAYDEVEAIYYFGERARGLWVRNYTDVQAAMAHAMAEHAQMMRKSVAHDAKLAAELCKAGGALCNEYASLGALAYRQALGAIKLVWVASRNDWWAFLKEMSTNGDMQTMDVVYPGSPLLLHVRPEILKRLLLPVLSYANNETFIRFGNPYSPHQLGTYPIGNATTIQQEPMPLENSGNMLFMLLGIAQRLGAPATLPWLGKYLPLLRRWVEELVRTAEFPANQLCTDDFTGRLPNNTNLGAKGTIAIHAFAELCDLLSTKAEGQPSTPLDGCADSAQFKAVAARYATTWQKYAYVATPAPHYKMSFNDIHGVADSWSLKYNLLWQRLLKLDGPFPDAVFRDEVAYYRTKANPFGIPLDPRHTWVKTDWLSWAACMSGEQADFEDMLRPIFKFANSTPSRHPFTDLYDTVSGKQSWGGFIARFVIGGLFARLME